MIRNPYALIGAAVLLLAPFPAAIADLASAQSSYERGRTTEALAEVDRLLEANPDDPEVRFLQGIIYAEQGRNADAIEVFAGLTQDYPELPEPYNNLAVLFAENGEFEKARDALMAAIQTHPSYSTAHENLGDLYAKMAGMAYDRALTEDRGNTSARVKLSAVNGLFSVPRVEEPVTVAAAATPPPRATPAVEPTPTPPVSQPEPEPVSRPAPEPEPAPATRPEPVPESKPEPEPEPVVAMVTEPESQPEPTPAPTRPAPGEDASAAIIATVTDWAGAWAGKNVDAYLASYHSSFVPPNGAARGAWERYRRSRINAPSFIEVDVSDFDVEVIDADSARVTFRQAYRSDTYRDVVRKTMTLERVPAGWQIASESSAPL